MVIAAATLLGGNGVRAVRSGAHDSAIEGRFPDDRTLTVGFTDNGLLSTITVEHPRPARRPAGE